MNSKKIFFILLLLSVITNHSYAQVKKTSYKDTLFEDELNVKQQEEWQSNSANMLNDFYKFLAKNHMHADCNADCDMLSILVSFSINEKGECLSTLLSKKICYYKLSTKQLLELKKILNHPINFSPTFYNKIFVVRFRTMRLMC